MLGPSKQTAHLYSNYTQTLPRLTGDHHLRPSQQHHQDNYTTKMTLQNGQAQPYYYHHYYHYNNNYNEHQSYSNPANQQQFQKLSERALVSPIERQAMISSSSSSSARPLCRCRVMYLGSSVPHITKNGLHGIQEPLKHLYPEEQFSTSKLGNNQQQTNQQQPSSPSSSAANGRNNTIDISHLSSSLGIDSWLSVWSNGLLLENVDEFGREIKRFFSIESLHYCAAVRFFDTTTLKGNSNSASQAQQTPTNVDSSQQLLDINADANNNNSTNPLASDPSEQVQRQQTQRKSVVRFLPLDAPLFQCPGMIDANHPPVFAAIMRRTTGIKVLECHAFICRRDAAANALVRSCTHAYADFLRAKRLSLELVGCPNLANTEYMGTIGRHHYQQHHRRANSLAPSKYSRSGNYEVIEPAANGLRSINGTTKDDNNNNNSLATTSNEDNSLEASSEDNYAIISKNNHRPQLTTSQQQPTNNNNHNNKMQLEADPNQQSQESQQESRRSSKLSSGGSGRRKASTRSLFNDFMPAEQDKQQVAGYLSTNSKKNEMEKLSHSLDLLERTDCCNVDNDCDHDNNQVKYSIVRNKRHSKSMQNLDGSYEFSASAARSSSRLARRGKHLSRRTDREHGGKGGGFSEHRKSASFQDIMATNTSIMTPTAQPTTDHSKSPSSHRRQGSIGSLGAIYSNASGSQRNSWSISAINKQQLTSQQDNSAGQHYETCGDFIVESQRADDVRSERPLYQVRSRSSRDMSSADGRQHHRFDEINYSKSKTLGSRAKKSSLKRREHQSRSREVIGRVCDNVGCDNLRCRPTMPEPQAYYMSQPAYYHHHQPPAATFKGQQQPPPVCGHLYPSQPIFAPLPGYHLPHHYLASAAGPPPQQALYGPPLAPPLPSVAGSIYDSPMQPPPLAPSTYSHHPHQIYLAQQQQQQHQYAMAAAAIAPHPHLSSSAKNKWSSSNNNHKGTTKSLARFRCLSPPVNFLSSPKSQPHQQQTTGCCKPTSGGDTSTTTTTDVTAEVSQRSHSNLNAGSGSQANSGHDSAGEPTTVAAAAADQTGGQTRDELPDVVSAEPGFIISANNNSAGRARHHGGQQANGKKMSWIKRLSLTMTSGFNSDQESDDSGLQGSGSNGKPSTDPNGSNGGAPGGSGDSSDATQTVARRKKRSSLFSGSLTLGRSNKQHAKLITSPAS